LQVQILLGARKEKKMGDMGQLQFDELNTIREILKWAGERYTATRDVPGETWNAIASWIVWPPDPEELQRWREERK